GEYLLQEARRVECIVEVLAADRFFPAHQPVVGVVLVAHIAHQLVAGKDLLRRALAAEVVGVYGSDIGALIVYFREAADGVVAADDVLPQAARLFRDAAEAVVLGLLAQRNRAGAVRVLQRAVRQAAECAIREKFTPAVAVGLGD